MIVAETMLPKEFSDLEPFASTWCLAAEDARYQARLSSTMDEMQAFYDAVVSRADEAMDYCDKFPLDDLPDDALNLLHLLYSMVMVSFPVEAFGQPHIPDTGAAYLDCLVAPGP
jgi:hypothetical protein